MKAAEIKVGGIYHVSDKGDAETVKVVASLGGGYWKVKLWAWWQHEEAGWVDTRVSYHSRQFRFETDDPEQQPDKQPTLNPMQDNNSPEFEVVGEFRRERDSQDRGQDRHSSHDE